MDLQIPSEWHCEGTLVTTVLTEDCTVTATTTYRTAVNIDNFPTTTASSSVPYGDWLFANSIIIFLLAFIPISALFGLFKRRR